MVRFIVASEVMLVFQLPNSMVIKPRGFFWEVPICLTKVSSVIWSSVSYSYMDMRHN
jgi:hypothetical protein